jgi:hypothetical protein
MNARDLLEKLVDCAMARIDKLGDRYKIEPEDDLSLSTLFDILEDVEVYATHQPQYPLRGRVCALNIMSKSQEDSDQDCIVIGVKDLYPFQGKPIYGSMYDFEDLSPYEIYLDGTFVDEDEGS